MLFEPLSIGTMTARNRLFRAATAESLATPAGAPSDDLISLYCELAEGGAGTVVTGYGYICHDGKPSERALSFADDGLQGAFRNLAGAVHERGACIVAQLVYGGSKSKLAEGDERLVADAGSVRRIAGGSDSGNAPGALQPNVRIVGPSSIENPSTGLVPVAATHDELDRIRDSFALAAKRVCSYGFDGVEVHAAHGYLLGQFLSPLFNERSDEYGGSLENRARFACECVAAVRACLPAGYPVLVKLNSSDSRHDDIGFTRSDSLQAARMLVDAGASAIEVSGDWHSFKARDVSGDGFFRSYGAKLADEVDVPVIVTGGWRNAEYAERALSTTGIAAIGMSRPLICEPDLPHRWESGDLRNARCISCNRCCAAPGVPCGLKARYVPARGNRAASLFR